MTTPHRPSISILNYGSGNIHSVANMIRRAGADPSIIKTPEEIMRATRLILPGIGAFDHCRHLINQNPGLEDSLRAAVARGTPLLGICVGMQLLASESEEGVLPGLNLIPGRVQRFSFNGDQNSAHLKIPHMGWRSIEARPTSRLFTGDLAAHNRFYFVHSYHYRCANPSDIAATAEYGVSFAAAVERNNIYGVQFHPEKSHKYGLALIKNFSMIEPA